MVMTDTMAEVELPQRWAEKAAAIMPPRIRRAANSEVIPQQVKKVFLQNWSVVPRMCRK
jgi:hypothetical protein